jgi:hypothetical protein
MAPGLPTVPVSERRSKGCKVIGHWEALPRGSHCRISFWALSRLRFLRLRLRASADLMRFFWPGFK